ncbi:MAG: DUF6640 family protein [Pseudomonadota bacterium]
MLEIMLPARISLTISALLFSVGPTVVDLSPSHVFNDAWPPHARFHMVWLLAVLAVAGLATFAGAWLIKDDQVKLFRLITLPGWLVIIPFFAAVLTVGAYGGSLSDLPDAPKVLGVDGNIVGFSISAIFQAIASFYAWRR